MGKVKVNSNKKTSERNKIATNLAQPKIRKDTTAQDWVWVKMLLGAISKKSNENQARKERYLDKNSQPPIELVSLNGVLTGSLNTGDGWNVWTNI